MSKYILEGHKPIPVDDILAWGQWFENMDNSRVAFTELENCEVSTVFLGLDHQWGTGPPLLFETMIFGGSHNEYQERYATWEEAEDGHKRAIAMAKEISP
jgi:hypothetical protein